MDVATDKWNRVKQLFDQALQHRRDTRAAFLAQNCSEEDLRDLVEKLLECHEEASGFLASSQPARAAALTLRVRPKLSPGDVLAERFKITRLIAIGGMGEVYQAEDLVLRDTVAIKIIRPEILEKPRSLERFKREVLLAKQVAHPNVCRVHDLFLHPAPTGQELQTAQTYFVSMELLQGETLAERLRRSGKMTTAQALPIVIQMASALSAAHKAGIIHRDFKPGNVVLVPSKAEEDVRAVVTDFGLAFKPESEFTATLTLTTQNEVLGTPAYASPEQIEGRELTSASDIYSFGLVVYEMVTGVRPFGADTPISMALKRLSGPVPSPRNVVPDLDATWEKVILKCVAREPSQRYEKPEQIIGALRNAEKVPTEGRSGQLGGRLFGGIEHLWCEPLLKFGSVSPSARRSKRVLLLASVAFFVLIVTAFSFAFWPAPELRPGSWLQLTDDGSGKGWPLLTDGVRVYFTAGHRPGSLVLSSVGVEGGVPGTTSLSVETTQIFDFSPSQSMLLANRPMSHGAVNDLWLLPLFGGSPRRLLVTDARAAQFSPDKKRIAYISGQDLFIMNTDGMQREKIASVPARSDGLRWSPDAKRFRFTRSEYVHGVTQESLWEIAADGTNLHQLLSGWHDPPLDCCGSWTPDGRFYVFQSIRDQHSELWAIPERQTIFGRRTFAPIRITSALLDLWAPLVSSDGKRLFALGIKQRGELVHYNAALNEFSAYLGGISATWVTFSKTGRMVAYLDYSNKTLWRANADGRYKKQITFAPLEIDGFSWSPDETQFAIRARERNHTWRIYLVPSFGGTPVPLMEGEDEQGVPTWSADGTSLCFGDVPSSYGQPEGKERIRIFDLRTRQPFDLPGSEGLWTSRWSPDGHFISALTIKGGRLVIFDVQKKTWHPTDALEVSSPNWSSDEKYIYYDTEPHDRVLARVRVADGKVTQLVSLADYPGLARGWSGLAPDNSPLLLRDLGSSEIYSLSLEYK